MKPKVVCIIPARGGSKGILRKNLRLLRGKPLLAYSIEAAKQAKLIDRVIVSSDDDEIMQVARHYGAETPFKRPEEFSTDEASTESVLKHALDWLNEHEHYSADIVVYLQTTDIFRKKGWIDKVIQKLIDEPLLESAFVAYKTHKNYWRKTADGYERVVDRPYLPRQKKEPLFREDTGLACATRTPLVKEGKRVGKKVWVLENDDFNSSIDIHDELDLWLAEVVMKKLSSDTEYTFYA